MEQVKKSGIIGFVKDLMAKVQRDDAIPYAYQLTYSLLLAIFPFLIFLLTLVGFMNLDPTQILGEIKKVMPGDAYSMVEPIITTVTTKQNGALLSVSILTAIWSAAGGFKAFMAAMNKVMGLKEDRSFIAVNFNAVLMVIFLAVGIVGSLLLMVFAQPIIDTITGFIPGLNIDAGLKIIAMILPVVFVFVIFLLFYMFVPARNVRFKYALPGAIFAAVAFLVVSLGFKIYVDMAGNYDKFYGSMGSVIVLMFWLLLVSIIMVMGGEINSLIIKKKRVSPYREGSKPNPQEIQPDVASKVLKAKKENSLEEGSRY